MIRVIVRSTFDQKVLLDQNFDSHGSAVRFLQPLIADKIFGQSERWVLEEDLTILGEDKSKAAASHASLDGRQLAYRFLADFQIEFSRHDSR